MRVLVIGYGSIGRRHVRNLIDLAITDIVLLREKGTGNGEGLPEIRSPSEIRSTEPEIALVCSPTHRHAAILEALLGTDIHVLCEKPLLATREELTSILEKLRDYRGIHRVAFHLRFHPSVVRARALLADDAIGEPLSARFEVGQYLPDWRPGRDHRESYSAHRAMGGGVTLDLIHEIDLAEYLLGAPAGHVSACVARVSDVTVDSEDIAEILYRTGSGAVVSIHLDYLFRGYHRYFVIVGGEGTIRADLAKGLITLHSIDGSTKQSWNHSVLDRNAMYVDVLNDFLGEVTGRNPNPVLPSFQEDVSVMRTALGARETYVDD